MLEADWSLMGWKATEYTTKFLQVCFTFTSKKEKKNPNTFVRKKSVNRCVTCTRRSVTATSVSKDRTLRLGAL